MQYFAFFGTGECDPNKDLKQFIAFLGFIAGWFIVVRILKKVDTSEKSRRVKIAIKALTVFLAIIGSILLLLATWIGLACGR